MVIGQNALSCILTSASKCTLATGAVKELKLASHIMELHIKTATSENLLKDKSSVMALKNETMHSQRHC